MIYVTKKHTQNDVSETHYQDLAFTFWGLVHELKAYEEPFFSDDPTVFEVENQENTWTIHFSSKNSPELLTLWRKAFDKSRGVRKAWLPLACDLGV